MEFSMKLEVSVTNFASFVSGAGEFFLFLLIKTLQ